MSDPSNMSFPEFRAAVLRVFDDHDAKIKRLEQALADLRRQLEELRRKP